MHTKISVVIPTYKRPKLLIRCLRALLTQNINPSDFEVIVVSDGPDNETLLMLLPWLKKRAIQLSYLHTVEKNGPAAARNLGWSSAKSPLIAFTDDDCLPHQDWLKSFLANYKGEKYIAFSGKTQVPCIYPPTDFALNTTHLEKATFITANCACTKSALFKAGGFDERFKLAWREDSDLEFKFLHHHVPILSIPEAIVVHPVREVPWGISIKEQKKGIYEALLFKKFPALYYSKRHYKPIWNYYLINICWILLFVSIRFNLTYLMVAAIIGLILLIGAFVVRRLKHTRRSLKHITEIITTSIIIPTLSVYWRIYGAIKYRVFFL